MTINLRELFAVSTDMNDKVLIKLLTAIKDGLHIEFDYIKFKQSYKGLIALGMDESTAAKSAFITASTMGITKDKLLLTVQHYKNVLNKEKEQFALALKNQIATNIDAKSMEVKRLHEKVEDNKRKIAQLEKEQTLIAAEILTLEESANSSKAKIEETRDNFKATFDLLYKEIEEDGLLYDRIL